MVDGPEPVRPDEPREPDEPGELARLRTRVADLGPLEGVADLLSK